jgi:WD40 repeat protein
MLKLLYVFNLILCTTVFINRANEISILKECFSVADGLSIIEWNYNGDLIAIGGEGGIYIYNTDFEFLFSLIIPDENYAISLDWDINENYLIVLYPSGNIYVWDVEHKKVILNWFVSTYTPRDIAWIPDHSLITTLGYGGLLSYNTLNDAQYSSYSDESPFLAASNLELINNHYAIFQFVSTSSAPVIIFDLENFSEIKYIDEVVLFIFTWDMNNEKIFWAGHNLSDRETPLQNEIYTTDKNGGNKEFFASFIPNPDNTLTSGRGFYSLSLNTDSTYLATFGFDQWIYIWKVDDKTLVTSFEGLFVEPPAYDSLAWSPDGQFLGNVGANGQACIWDMSHLE